MAYVEQYTANFTNEQGQEVVVSILQKDGTTPVSVENYPIVSLTLSANSDSQDSYACIISKELSLTIWTESTDTVTWETFIASTHDEWKVIVTVDGVTFFIGFLSPDEGSAPFQDKPYEVNLKATDGLGLLKGYELTQIDETKFKGFYTLIQYVSSALYKTALDLPIRIYSNIFHASMLNKGDSLDYDIFQEIELNGRTFLQDVNSYENCYEALKILLDGWCSIEQYEGKWQIVTLSERQYIPGSRYYVDYAYDGTTPVGAIDTETVAEVGKDELIYPINESQVISSQFANKQVKHIFNYVVPDDLVDNQGLQFLGAFSAPLSGSGYTAWDIVDWSFEKNWVGRSAASGTPYIKIETDAFDKQIDRYYVIPNDTTGTSPDTLAFIRNNNDDFFVDAGDKLGVSISFKEPLDRSDSFSQIYGVQILVDGGDPNTFLDWWSYNDVLGAFQNGYLYTGCGRVDGATVDVSEWVTLSFEQVEIPVSGTCYIMLKCGSLSGERHFKDLKINYTPYVRGSRFYAKGDYHLRSQTNNFPDKYEQTVKISDSPKRIIKGSMFWTNAVAERILLDPTWYRYPNTTESYNFKELTNLGKFNQTYRRFYKIEGDFTSLFYTDTLGTIRRPLSFHKAYRFMDISPTRDFVLVPSLEMDLVTGNCKCVFVEVYKDSADGTTNGDVDKFDYIF